MLQIEGVGNLGAKPEKKMVKVDGVEKPLVTMRVYFFRRGPDGNGRYVDLEGMWREVTIWKPRLGDRVIEHLDKGARIFVRGAEIANSYEGGDGEQVASCTIVADYVAPDLVGIGDISFKKRASKADPPAAEGDADLEDHDREAAD